MKFRVQLSQAQRDDLAVIAEIEPDRLKAAAELLRNQPAPSLRLGELRTALQGALEREEAGAVVRQAVSLLTLQRRRRFHEGDIADAVTRALTKQAGWDDDGLGKWHKVRPIFMSILSLDAVVTVVKALDLSFDYANWLDGVRILTDIRPVYDRDHKRMIGAIVSQVLRLEYESEDGRHTLSLALNEQDVAEIGRVCEDAKGKAREALANAQAQGLKAFIAGSENYDPD